MDDWRDIGDVLGMEPITGGFTVTLSDPDRRLFEAIRGPVATVTIRYRVKWWKRPWLWMRRRPTSSEHVYENVAFSPMTLSEDGSVSVDFTAEPRP